MRRSSRSPRHSAKHLRQVSTPGLRKGAAFSVVVAVLATFVVAPNIAVAAEPTTPSTSSTADKPAETDPTPSEPTPSEDAPTPPKDTADKEDADRGDADADQKPATSDKPSSLMKALGAVIAPMSTTPGTSLIRVDTTFYAYVVAGENVDINFTQVSQSGAATITVRAPGAAARTCTKAAIDPTACVWTNLTSGTTGIWEITFDALDPTSRAYDWTINVQSAANVTIPGRVYTEKYLMSQFGPTMTSDMTLWYQSEHGFQYRADYSDYNGADSSFASDATGVANLNTCVSAYRSIDEGNLPTFPYADGATFWLPPVGQCGDPYKIFFDAPSASLPATAKLWDGTTQWLQPPVELPTLSALAFTRDNAATTAGEFTFDVTDFTGQLEVLIDANNDGDYTDAVDTKVPAAVTQDGTVTVAFAGLDGQGNAIPASQPIGAKVAITKVGEIHFVNSDVETRTGLQVTAINGPDTGVADLYWNDTDLRVQDRIPTCLTPQVDGRAGVPSSGGVHGWPCTAPTANSNDGVHGSWGDVRDIDDWTYHAIDEFDEIEIPASVLDFGDAPNTYGTNLAGNGPHHQIIDGVHLGADIDDETNGQPNAAADGDGADEDGVKFNPALGYPNPTLRTGVDPDSQQPIENTLAVDASADGFVSVWVDWNQDGDFADSDERVANAKAVTAGSNDITFDHAGNPPGIQTYVRVRYSTDDASIADPTGAAPDGEVEDYRVLVERLIQPDTCDVTDTEYYSFTFGDPIDEVDNGGALGSRSRYENVTVIGGQAVDMVVEVVAGQTNGAGTQPENGFGGNGFGLWYVVNDATVRYSFYEAGTTTPVDINGVFTATDMDGTTGLMEIATFDAGDLTSYAVTQGSAVTITQSAGKVAFHGNGDQSSGPESRFQVVMENKSTFDVRWQGGANSGFQVFGNGELGIQPPACDDFGDAPNSYKTLLADNGPRHTIKQGMFLGTKIDFDTNGQPNAAADGDDANRVADEDGVTFNPALGYANPTLRTGVDPDSQQPIENTLAVDASVDGFVSVWVDWNQDGDFADADERVANGKAVTAGSNDITFDHGTNPPGIQTYVRVRYSTDAASIAAPTGAAPDGEVEDYRVLVERLIQPDTCTVTDTEYYAFTFGTPTNFTGTGGPGSTARYANVTVVDGVAVDMFVQVISGDMREAGSGGAPPNGFWLAAPDDAAWQIDPDATLRYSFYKTGTTTPVAVNAVFTVDDMDSPEKATFVTADLAGYAVTQGSTVAIIKSGAYTIFDGTSDGNSAITQRFQVVLEGKSTFQASWNGFTGSGFSFDGDGDKGIQPPACSDFGDAPSSYKTLLADNGPRHTLTQGLFMGTLIDFDPDGQPNAAAIGDDFNRLADEDGVTGGITVTPGRQTKVTVSATNNTTAAATLVGWIDLNGDGAFSAGERVSIPVPANSGQDDYELDFPGGTLTSNSFARFRLFPGTPSDPQPTGAASAGEVEDYAVAIADQDFGDAPNSFGTTLADNGPRHGVVDGLGIGSDIDDETDGQPSAAADGDGADEDAFPNGLVLNPGDTNPTLTVPVTNTTGGAATLSGWIDSDNDGRFEPSEFASIAVPDGATSVDLAFAGIPALQDGTSPMVRLRLTTDTITDNTGTPNDERALGAAGDGEVEDHVAQVATVLPVSCSDPFVEDFGTGAGFGPALPGGQTTYQYIGSPDPDGQMDANQYAVVPSPLLVHNAWHDGQDHTVGDTNGRMMAVNASVESGILFQRTFTGLAPGARYDFSAWIANVVGINTPDLPNVTFRVIDPATGNVLSQVDTGDIPNKASVVWERFALRFTASQPTVRLELVNNTPGSAGNDLAIDDITFTNVCEFGDAPDSYGTLLGSNGPGHIAAGPTLGTERDTEPDGQPNAAADGDDTAGTPDDEDGVATPITMSVGSGTTVSVSATNDSDEDITLAGWIDLNGNGTFQDSERVTVKVPAKSGTKSYDLAFPAVTTTTDTYARFRIYGEEVTDPKPTGTAPAGEVEDYRVTVLQPDLEIEKTSDATADSRPGDTITYTVTGTNTGAGDYTSANPARVWDDLTGVLDDATFDGTASADRGGNPVYQDPIISWTGALPAGEKVTITYTVKLKGGGDGTVRNVAFAQCDPSDPACDTVTPVCDPPVGGIDPDTGKACAPEEFELPKLTIAKVADRTDLPAVGDTVKYTVTVKNVGPGDYTSAKPGTISDDLSDVIDNTTDPTAITSAVGMTTFSDPKLTWTGVLAAGDSATITYEVTYTGGGDQQLTNNACIPVEEAADPQDPCAVVEIPGSGLDQDKVANPVSGSSVVVGEVVTYTLRFDNTGKAPATVDTFDDLSAVLDDADFVAGSISADTGITATYDGPGERIDITGSVPVGGSLEVTYQVKVKALADQGDHVLRNALQCQAGDPQPCDPISTEHRVRALEIKKTSNRTAGTVVGDKVTYTVTAKNIGEADYTALDPAIVRDSLAGVLDDADYNGDLAADKPGTLSYAAPVLQWTGALAKDDTVTLTYTVKLKAGGDMVVRNVAWGDGGGAPKCDPPNADGVDPDTLQPCAEEEFLLPNIIDKKSVNPADGSTVAAGEELTYTLTFENTGKGAGAVSKDDALGMLVDDAEIVSGPTVAGQGNLTATLNGSGDLIAVRGTLGAGETATVTYKVKVKSDADRKTDGGDNMLGNFLIEPGTTPPTACLPEADEDSTCNPVPHIIDKKSVDPSDGSTVKAGDELTYTLTFENTGKGAGAVSKDDALAMLLDDADIISGPTSSDPAITATLDGDVIEIRGTLKAGDTVTVTYTVKVKSDADRAADGGDDMLGNFLIEQGTTPPTACLPEADEDSTCNPVPNIIDKKSVDPADGSTVTAGDELTYTLTFENTGKGEGAVSKDDALAMLLDDAEIVSGPTSSDPAALTATLDDDLIKVRGTLAAGDKVTVTYKVKVKSDAKRTADGGDDMLGNFLIEPGTTPPTACLPEADEDSTCNPVPHIIDKKSVNPSDGSTVVAGDELTYTLTFENTGKADGEVKKDDYLGMLLDDATAVAPGIVVSDPALTVVRNGDVIEIRGTLAKGQKVTVTYTVKVKSDADRVADGGDDMLGNFLVDPGTIPPTACLPEADEDSTCNPVPRIVDWKSVTPSSNTPVVAGQSLTYTLTFTNRGQAAGDVDKVDDLTHVLDDADVVTEPKASDPALTVTRKDEKIAITGKLAKGQTVTVTYTVKVKSDAKRGDDILANFLIKSGETPPEDPNDCVPAEGEDADCTTNPVGAIVPSKTVNPKSGTTVKDGRVLTYTLSFGNPGKGAAKLDYTDHMAGVLDDAKLIGTPKSSAGVTVSGPAKGALHITGQVAAGQTATVTYKVKVMDYADQGNHHLGNFVTMTGQKPPTTCVAANPLCTENPTEKPAVDGGWLPDTGGSPLGLLGIAGFLIAGGTALLIGKPRRRETGRPAGRRIA